MREILAYTNSIDLINRYAERHIQQQYDLVHDVEVTCVWTFLSGP